MRQAPDFDVSVVIPFSDAEESVGGLARRVAEHLRALGLSFELIGVDEDSGDNSCAVLAMLRTQLPELIVLGAGDGRGFAAGARIARGRVLWLIDVKRARSPLAPFHWAYARVTGPDAADAVVVPGRYVVCRRTRAWRVLDAVRGRGDLFERRFQRRAHRRHLRVETPPLPGASRGALARFVDSLVSPRFGSP